jgi:hypothetical protein
MTWVSKLLLSKKTYRTYVMKLDGVGGGGELDRPGLRKGEGAAFFRHESEHLVSTKGEKIS